MKILTILFLTILFQPADASIVPEDAYTFDFNIKMIRMPRLKEDKVHEATDLLREIFASEDFKKKVLNHKFNGRRQFAFNKKLSNRQIYEKILQGMERLVPYKNNAMDVEIELYADYESTVLGYTRPSTKRIWMNKKYFNKHTPAELASHLTHEWLHKLGFDHEKKRSSTRGYTVPYAIGYIVRDLAEKLVRDRAFNSRY